MTMNEDRDDIDSAIDRAIRETMSVDTDAAFRVRVMERLEIRDGRTAGWPRAAVAFGLTAAVLAAIIFVQTREPGRPDPASAPPVAAAPAGAAGKSGAIPADQRPGQVSASLPAPRPTDGRPAGPRGAGRTISATMAPDPESSVEIAPLARLEPIEVIPLEQSTIAPAAIEIAALTPITEVQVAPLSPPSERD
jgi:hypothetical protein